MKTEKRRIRLPALLATLVIILLFGGQAFAVDDGARAYWKGRHGTQGFSIQYLTLDLQASGSEQFAPGQYVYGDADVEATLFIANYARNLVLFNRLSSVSLGVAGGSVDVNTNANASTTFLPPF
jgi:hypothetical protein